MTPGEKAFMARLLAGSVSSVDFDEYDRGTKATVIKVDMGNSSHSVILKRDSHQVPHMEAASEAGNSIQLNNFELDLDLRGKTPQTSDLNRQEARELVKKLLAELRDISAFRKKVFVSLFRDALFFRCIGI